MSRIHYAFNPRTGEWLFGSSLSSPLAVAAMLEKTNLEGFQVTSVDVMDSGWRMVKAAIDNRNNINQMTFFANQVEGANREAKLEAEAAEKDAEAARARKVAQQEEEARIAAAVKAKEQAIANQSVVKGGEDRSGEASSAVAPGPITEVEVDDVPTDPTDTPIVDGAQPDIEKYKAEAATANPAKSALQAKLAAAKARAAEAATQTKSDKPQ